jgi:protein-tyrosine phosphatase
VQRRRRPRDARGRAPEAIIQHFLADLTAAHGSVEAYIKDGVGVGDDVVAALRERLLVR